MCVLVHCAVFIKIFIIMGGSNCTTLFTERNRLTGVRHLPQVHYGSCYQPSEFSSMTQSKFNNDRLQKRRTTAPKLRIPTKKEKITWTWKLIVGELHFSLVKIALVTLLWVCGCNKMHLTDRSWTSLVEKFQKNGRIWCHSHTTHFGK